MYVCTPFSLRRRTSLSPFFNSIDLRVAAVSMLIPDVRMRQVEEIIVLIYLGGTELLKFQVRRAILINISGILTASNRLHWNCSCCWCEPKPHVDLTAALDACAGVHRADWFQPHSLNGIFRYWW